MAGYLNKEKLMLVMNVNPNHLRVMFYKYGKVKNATEEEAQNMIYNCAKEYKILLINNIMFGKFSGMYPDLNPTYKKWKKKQGALDGFWKLWGSLVNSISIRETPKGYSIGIEKNVMPMRTSSMGKKKKITPVWMYAWYGEYSHRQQGIFNGVQPSRPVFRPTQFEYQPIFKEKRAKEAFSKIRNSW